MPAIPPVQSVPSLPGIGGLEAPGAGAPASGPSGFADVVADKIERVQELEREASAQSRAVATGMSDDLAGALLGVQQADLALQFATQVRNKAVEAYQEVMRMQV
ncbi:fliE: flagellar hook-basal body complex protein FliE [Gaiella occulta]|uniref:Flagellar hook-basal body complex protein FliE n=1 Tax=Gaiella occulta TaxID=1002870 RepID=A0A7M2Z0W6_9ACTN|nr:flagellar hook-basal body complex protein FliE [Gaiella occulta]RDI75977.1 fliE: flagellar hook-basal body complex protein FliE [Gaiella occulta]